MKTASMMLAALVVATVFASGCGQSGTPQNVQQKTSAPSSEASATSKESGEAPNDGWWCTEHGMPEEICAQCNSKLAAEFKKKGDWCKEHDRPESQCFICHPELEAKFAAKYEAKYGKKPPKPEVN